MSEIERLLYLWATLDAHPEAPLPERFPSASEIYGEISRLKEQIRVERQRANALLSQSRLPEELVERIRTAIEDDEQFNGYLMKRILEDVLAAVEQKP